MTLRLDRKQRLVVPESSLESAVATIMQLDGWRYFHTEWALTQGGRPVLEVDMADALFIRYLAGAKIETSLNTGCTLKAPCAEVLWCEFKRIGEEATGAQRLWHAAERKRGAMVIVAGIDFVATSEGYLAWYQSSGLQRRRIL